jgi:hypothetical protein
VIETVLQAHFCALVPAIGIGNYLGLLVAWVLT